MELGGQRQPRPCDVMGHVSVQDSPHLARARTFSCICTSAAVHPRDFIGSGR